MMKEIVILAIAFLALCNAEPVEEASPEVVPLAVPVESADESGSAPETDDDLAPAASAWGHGGWGRGYYGRGWGGGWGRGYGGWGGHRGYGWGHGGYGGWGRGYYWG